MTIETHSDVPAPAPNPDRGPNARDQRTFDIVVRKLARQGRPSAVARATGSTMKCLYLAPNGDRCAAGHLLDLTDSEMSGLDSCGVLCSPQIQHLLAQAGHDPRFASRMQAAHDNATHDGGGLYPEEWLATWAVNMRKVAESRGLSVAVLDAELEARATTTSTAREVADRQLNGAVSLVRCVIEATKLELADRIDVGCDDDACDRVLSGKFVSVRVRYDDSSGAFGEPVTVLELRRDVSGTWHHVCFDGQPTSDGFASARAAAAAALADDLLSEQVAIKLAKLTS